MHLTFKALTPPGKTKDEIGAGRTVVAGGVAGVTLWTIIFPADVVKSRLQVILAHLKNSQLTALCARCLAAPPPCWS